MIYKAVGASFNLSKFTLKAKLISNQHYDYENLNEHVVVSTNKPGEDLMRIVMGDTFITNSLGHTPLD